MLKKLVTGIHLRRLSKNLNALLAKVVKLPTQQMLKFYDITWNGVSKTLIGVSEKVFTPENCKVITEALISYYTKEQNGAGVEFKKKF